MGKWLSYIKKYLPTQRRLIQLYAALLYNAHVKGFVEGNIYTGNIKNLCVPGLNCYSCPGSIGACPLGALQNAIASSGHRAPYYMLGILMLYGLICGRTICGFLCPAGLLQELLHKLPTPKIQKNRFTRLLSFLKYVVLVVFVAGIPAWFALRSIPLPAFCKYICPAGTFEGAIGLLANPVNADKYAMLGSLFTSKFLILVVLAGICVFVYRAFCRFLCPLGAIYGLFSKVAFVGVKVNATKCVDCGRCIAKCKMDIHHVGDHECIHCGECIDVCPTSAIAFKAGKYTICEREATTCSTQKKHKRRMRGILAWITALVLLAAVLYIANKPDIIQSDSSLAVLAENATADTSPATEAPPVGKEVGMLAPAFSAPLYGSEELFSLDEHHGKTIVVNFWATWCTPCIQELPHFDEVYQRNHEDVVVIAIHSNLVTDNVEAFLAKHDYQMPFALDATGDIIKSFGGSTMLPHTVIIDPNGIIAYNAVGSLTYEKLEALLSITMSN